MSKSMMYRTAVFAVFVAYCLRMIFFGNWDAFAGPFKYLTIWSLFISTFALSRTLLFASERSTKRWDGFVAMSCVISAMVVFLYWRLFFADPMSVTSDGTLGDWWLEYFLHGVGPLLLWIEALFFHKPFRKWAAAIAWMFGVIASFVLWMELVLQPLVDSPVGEVTSGLPYRFLNNMDFGGRSNFYVTNFVVAVVFLAVFIAVSWVINRFQRQAMP